MATSNVSVASGTTNSSSPPSGTDNMTSQIVVELSPSAKQDQAATPISLDPWVLSPENLGDEIFTLYIGPEYKKITAHKKILVDRCDFFSKAFCVGFPGAETGEMTLLEEDPITVASLIDYLYRGELPIGISAVTGYRMQVDLYLLAEKLQMTALMDKCLDAIHCGNKANKKVPGLSSITLIYSKTSKDSKLRNYCTAVVACSVAFAESRTEQFERHLELYAKCPDFFLDYFRWQTKHGVIVTRALEMFPRGWGSPLELIDIFGPCRFHSHGRREPCYLKDGK